MKKYWVFIALLISCKWVMSQETVTIKGRVTDYNGNVLDSVSLFWHRSDFSTVYETLTDENGFYTATVPRGKYQSMGAINLSEYPHFQAARSLPEPRQRLEFWAWNFIADRDTILDLRYHRMEAYGLNVFYVQGGAPAYVIYVRPMSLTRYQQWSKNKSDECSLAPSPENLSAEVTIDGQPVEILMKQEIKEYFEKNQWGNAYLLTVQPPSKKQDHPYRVVKVVLTDLENGDKGEGVYYLEKNNYF